jgi:hypothetical protein
MQNLSTQPDVAVEAFAKWQADEQALKDQQRREVSRFLGPQYSSNRRKYLDVQSYRANRRRH